MTKTEMLMQNFLGFTGKCDTCTVNLTDSAIVVHPVFTVDRGGLPKGFFFLYLCRECDKGHQNPRCKYKKCDKKPASESLFCSPEHRREYFENSRKGLTNV